MKFDIIRAWKDASYRNSLSAEELALLPSNPAGEIELTDADLEAVNGGCHCHGHHRGGSGSGGGTAVISAVRTLICVNSLAIGGSCNSFSVDAGCNTSVSNGDLLSIL
jgi:mersacidin/lichenicidin family type 2 lantibiotic